MNRFNIGDSFETTVVAVTDSTHRAIHYGDQSLLGIVSFNVRTPNDTCPWR